jgi:hypothetical protein
VDDVDAEDVWDDQRGVIVDQTSPRSNPQTLSQSLPSSASTSASVSSSNDHADPNTEIV